MDVELGMLVGGGVGLMIVNILDATLWRKRNGLTRRAFEQAWSLIDEWRDSRRRIRELRTQLRNRRPFDPVALPFIRRRHNRGVLRSVTIFEMIGDEAVKVSEFSIPTLTWALFELVDADPDTPDSPTLDQDAKRHAVFLFDPKTKQNLAPALDHDIRYEIEYGTRVMHGYSTFPSIETYCGRHIHPGGRVSLYRWVVKCDGA